MDDLDDDFDETEVVTFEEAKNEYEHHLCEHQEYMENESPKVRNFVFNRNRDAETLAFLMLDGDERDAFVN